MKVDDIRMKHSLIKSFLQLKGLSQQHIDSFNQLVDKKLHAIIMAKNNNRVLSEDHPDFYLIYESIRIGNPTHVNNYDRYQKQSALFPFEARSSDTTYAADILVSIKYSYNGIQERREGVKIGRLPIMLGSNKCHLSKKSIQQLAKLKQCPYDPFGYFVINGSQKVILIQQQLIQNRIIVQRNTKLDSIIAGVVSYTIDTKSVCCLIVKNDKIYFKSSSFNKHIPIFVLFKALGIQSDQQVFQLIGLNSQSIQALILSLQDSNNVHSKDEALHYLSQRLGNSKFGNKLKNSLNQVRNVLSNVILAHIPCKNYKFGAKARYLALMVKKLMQGMNDPQKLDNRDYYGNKRMKCAGQLLQLMFQDKLKQLNSQIKTQIKKILNKKGSRPQLKYILQSRSNIITKGIQAAIATGNWTIKRFNMERKGVSQLLSRISYISCLGMMMRINSQFQKTRKIAGPRALLGSHWGLICPCDTPDGQGCGLIKNLALCCNISTSTSPLPYLPIIPFELSNTNSILVMHNGLPLGCTNKPNQFTQLVRRLRRLGLISYNINVAYSQGIVMINSDSGRLIRPLIIVTKGKSLLTDDILKQIQRGQSFNQLISKGIVQYLDVNQQDNSLIALRENDICAQTTHLQIDPLTILGCVAGIIPFPNHNQSPRNTYQCSMGKQALGVPCLNVLDRLDTLNFFLIYTQKPLVKTLTIQLINYQKLPAGHNASVAVMSYSGYDIQDAIVVNKAALDRGFGRTLYLRRYQTNFKRYTEAIRQCLNKPSPINSRHHALDLDGLGRVGSILRPGDVYVNKITPLLSPDLLAQGNVLLLNKQNIQWTEEPTIYKANQVSSIDKVLITTNQDHSLLIKTLLRQTRRPELGDKFSSRHGQKGVVGLIVNQQDLPFSETGWRPDLIMNPHGYPSRMTVAKLMQLIAGKSAALKGVQRYGTPFGGGDNINQLSKILLQAGFSYSGKDILISGITGCYISCFVFCGPIYYQRLKHMVQDKIHARARGRVNMLTRQPTEGRARQGGLRLGQMERDCLLGFGASALLQERLMLSSDLYETLICQQCGQICYLMKCTECGKQASKTQMPYAFKLLSQQLQSMGIRVRLHVGQVKQTYI